jgi:hypothetical protein
MFMFTKLADLPRVTTVPTFEPEPALELDPAITSDVYKLGYLGALRAQERDLAASRRATRARALFQAMLEAGIRPLQNKAVQRYKTTAILRIWLRACGYQALTLLTWVGMMKAAVVMRPEIGIPLGVVAIIGGFVVSLGIWAIERPLAWGWRDLSLQGYERPIPMAALAVALKAEALAPTASLYVEELHQGAYVADPFLLLRVDGLEVYLAAWDEPRFTA